MNDSNVSEVLVTGASGYIGGRLVPRLLERGHRVTCLARDPARLAGRGWNARILAGDVLDVRALSRAMQGIDVAYYLIHSMAAGEAAFAARDRLAARAFADAASAAGVRRIVYLGALGEGRLSPHLASRRETADVLRASGVPVTELRAGVIVGAGSASFELIRYLVDRLPVMVCPRWVSTPCQPIAVDDVLRYLVAALEHPQEGNLTLEIGGADVLTYGDLMRRYAAVRGLSRRMVNVPFMTPRLSSWWCGLVTPVPASIARPLIDGLRTPAVVTRPVSEPFAFPTLGYDEAVRRALDRDGGVLDTGWWSSLASVGDHASPPVSLDQAEGLIREHRRLTVNAPADAVFRVLEGIGGARGWFYATAAWRLRALLDRLVGGIGLRRGRRDADALRVGDALDFWRVESLERPRRLRLRAEMKLPGRAWLQWTLAEGPRGTTLTQDALFEPRGLAGWVYWCLLYPAHRLIFAGMLRAIGARAEAA